MNRKRSSVPVRLSWKARLHSSWPFFVWVLAALLAVPLVLKDSDWVLGTRILGIVGKETIVVSPVETARIRRILVVPGETVTNGQPLVEMDTASIDYELAGDLLDAQRTAQSIYDRRYSLVNNLSQRKEWLADSQTALAKYRMTQAIDQAELDQLITEQSRRSVAFAEGMIDEIEKTELEPRRAKLQESVQIHAQLMQALQEVIADAKRQVLLSEQALEQFDRERISVDDVQHMVQRIEQETKRYRDSYVLRSPCRGTISEVRSEEGEVIRADRTVLRIVPESLSTVVALIPEQQSMSMHENEVVRIGALNCREKGRVNLSAVVESLSEEVRVEAALLNIGGRMVPMRSRRAILRLEQPEKSLLIAGEVVEITLPRVEKSFWGAFIRKCTSAEIIP